MKGKALTILTLTCMFYGLLGLLGCSENEEPEIQYQRSPQLITASRDFGVRLLNELFFQEGEKNIFISPLSISMALAMVYNGAAGETQRAMAETLDLNGMTLEEINHHYEQLQTELELADSEVELAIANSMWIREGREFYPDFIERNREFFRAEVATLDFSNPQAVVTINQWVETNTNGKISKVLNKGNVHPNTALLVMNATYFKGAWTKKFESLQTREKPFYLPDGSEKQVMMMYQSGRYSYLKEGNFSAIRLPYGADRICMYIFLPVRESSIHDFLREINAADLERWMESLEKGVETAQSGGMAGVEVELPRFRIEYDVELKDALSALGMEIAFVPGKADFSKMAPPPGLWIDKVLHNTFVEVNEKGTEAAAVTTVMLPDCVECLQLPHFVADRPFFFAIRDDNTGSVLFMGVVVEPM